MKLLANRFFILCKRSLKQPVNLVMLITLLVLAFIYRQIPASEKSMYIPVAVLCEDQDPEIREAAEELISRNSIFHFFRVADKEEMYDAISSGNANSGIYIPEGFGEELLSPDPEKKITLYTTPSSYLPSLCKDELFTLLFKRMALQMLKEKIEAGTVFTGKDVAAVFADADSYYDHYQNSTEIFRVEDASGGVYNEITREEKAEIPIRKLAGLFIFAAGMIGIATFLKDKEERLYLRLRGSERFTMQLLHIISAILPMAIISYPVILITEGGNPLSLLGFIALYTLTCIVYSLVCSLLIRRSSVYQKVLPVMLTMAIILGGVIFDVTTFEKGMKYLSMLFPPYYF